MEDNKAIAREFLESFWNGETDQGLLLCHPDAVWTFQRSLPYPNRKEPVAAAVELLMTTLIPMFDPDKGYDVKVHSFIGEGDEVSAEYSARGMTRTGGVYHNDYHVRFTLRDGLITSVRPYFDTHYVHTTLYAFDGAG